MAKLNMGKTRPVEDPYLILRDPRMPGWEWRVLKAYTANPDKQYAAWLCQVTSPYTGKWGDMGDTYIADCGGDVIWRDPVVADEDLPRRMRPGS